MIEPSLKGEGVAVLYGIVWAAGIRGLVSLREADEMSILKDWGFRDEARIAVGVLSELDAIKRLLILQLVTSGVRVDDVARSLGVTRKALLKIIPLKWLAREGRVA